MGEEPNKRLHLEIHFGLRIIKTVIAIFLSVVIADFIGGFPVNAALAAFICLQSTREATIKNGKNRFFGTVVGGLFSLIFLYIIDYFAIELFTIPYYLIMSLLLIPLINLTLILKIPDMTSTAVIVLLITLLSYVQQEDVMKYIYVLSRMIDTFIGVLISTGINVLIPITDGKHGNFLNFFTNKD